MWQHPRKNKFPILGIIRPAEQVNQIFDQGEPQRTFRIPLRVKFHWEGTEVATSLQSKIWDHSLSFSPSIYVKETSGLDSHRMLCRGKKNIQDYLNNKQYIIIKHLAVQVYLLALTTVYIFNVPQPCEYIYIMFEDQAGTCLVTISK